MSSDTLTLLKQYQKLINVKFEKAAYQCWIRSMQHYLAYLTSIHQTYTHLANSDHQIHVHHVWNYAWQLEFKSFDDELLLEVQLELVTNNQNKEIIKLKPEVESWKLALLDTVSSALKELTLIQCMRTREIESARDDMLCHIFDDLTDPNVIHPKREFTNLVNRLCDMLIVYVEKLKEFEYVLDY